MKGNFLVVLEYKFPPSLLNCLVEKCFLFIVFCIWCRGVRCVKVT